MPYEIGWIVPGQVMESRFWGEVSRADLAQFSGYMQRHLQKSAFHLIVHSASVTKINLTPKDITDMMLCLSDYAHGHICIVESTGFTRFIASVVMQGLGIDGCFFKNSESALLFLREHDSTITWEHSNFALSSY